MLMASGFLRQVFEVFERHDTPVDLIATSEVSISVTMDDVEHLGEIKADLAQAGRGEDPARERDRQPGGPRVLPLPGTLPADLRGLADVNVVMISFAASDVNISVVVAEADAERAVHSLHREFFCKSAAEPCAEEKSNQKGSGGRKNTKSGSQTR